MTDHAKRPITLRVSTWGKDGVGFATISLPESLSDPTVSIVGVTIEDGPRSITYDIESYNVNLEVDGRQVTDFEDQPIPVEA